MDDEETTGGNDVMQTIEEYKEYTKQLEDEVGKWHHAYDALMVERNKLVNELMELKRRRYDIP